MADINREELKHDPIAEYIVHQLAKIQKHWRQVVVGVCIAAVVIIAVAYHFSRKETVPQKASLALAQARTPDALEGVVRAYGGTFAAPAALAELGRVAIMETNYQAAIGYYQRLVAEYPKDFLVPAALLSVAKCYIELENYSDAETVLRRQLLYDRNHYAVAAAQLELVSLLVATKRYGEAWDELQAWDQTFRDSQFGSLADGLREKLMRLSGASTNLVAQQAS
ncbi:tetratricopeptide repeat protein [bacterium]|nr:tetratricopeptide repeat protein [bacterium]